MNSLSLGVGGVTREVDSLVGARRRRQSSSTLFSQREEASVGTQHTGSWVCRKREMSTDTVSLCSVTAFWSSLSPLCSEGHCEGHL